MNKKFFEILLNWPRSYIAGVDLHHILNKSSDSRHAIIKRAIQQGVLIPIRRDLYLIKNARKPLVNSFEIATIIYGPSYVSFESALSYHGWIPEAVITTTCATVKRDSEFTTPVGIFSYEHIPIGAFPFGVEQHNHAGVTLFIASPMKALADIIYARRRSFATLEDLYDDLRIEPDRLKSPVKRIMGHLIQNYPNTRVQNVLYLLQQGLPP